MKYLCDYYPINCTHVINNYAAMKLTEFLSSLCLTGAKRTLKMASWQKHLRQTSSDMQSFFSRSVTWSAGSKVSTKNSHIKRTCITDKELREQYNTLVVSTSVSLTF